MLESLKHEDLQFQELSPEEKQARGILARLSGPIASFTKGTRNGRKYSDKLWEKAFDAPLVKEMFKNGGLPGELQHPEDRSETDPTKIAIMMPEPPKKDSNGHLVASVDILDTPCGQIAYQLGKYGFKFGISSRGEGDLIQDFSGEESVDPDTYTLNAFDLVLIPACEDARLQFNESLNTKKSNKLKTILSEALENASDVDRKIMEEALDELNIDDNWRFVETYHDEDIYYDPDIKKYIVGDLDDQTVLNSVKNAKQYIDRYISEEVLTEEQVGREETKDSEKPSDLLQNKINQEEPEEQQDDQITSEDDEDELEEGLTPQQKMDAWHNGQRRENIRACGDRKLAGYMNICKDSGYDNEVGIIKQEFERRGIPSELYETLEEEIYDGYNSDRPSWDTDFHRLDVAYNHNFKQFDDMEADSGMIRDFTDDLEAQGKEYDIYKHESDPGCTIFFQESLTEDSMSIDWDDLNGTEQSAVEAAFANIRNGSTVEDAVHGAVEMYNEANSEEEYEDEDFFMEEANYAKVLDYVKNHEQLNEAKFGMFKYKYGVHAHPQGKDIVLCGSKNLEDAVRLGIEQADSIFNNPFMSNKEKYQYLETMYMANDDTEEVDISYEFDEYVDNLMSELQSRIMNEGKYTKDELLDKFGTTDLDIINAGNEETVELEEAVIPDFAKVLDSGYCNKDEWPEVKKEQLNKYKHDYKNVKCTLQKSDTKGLKMWVVYTEDNNEAEEPAADNDGALVEKLQNILKQNKSLEDKVKILQEKISVGYAKEMDLKEELDEYKQKVLKLSKKTKEVEVLTEKLSKAEKLLQENKKKANDNVSTLNESILSKDSEVKGLRKDISVLNETLDKKNSKIRSLNKQLVECKDQLSSKDDDIKQLEEKYETGQKDLEQVRENYSKKLEQQNQIIEKYRRVAKNSVKRYVESQAIRLGVKSDEIVNRLPKNYSFNDIDKICEDLQEYKFNMSNLPFNSQMLNENIKINAKNIDNRLVGANPEDEITEYDLKVAEAFL